MNREFCIVLGAQGMGKSLWAKLKTRGENRLFVYDPMASFPRVLFADAESYAESIINGRDIFRLGSSLFHDLPLLGSLSFVAGDCTFVVEECGTIFVRGEELADWLKRVVYMGRHQSVNLYLVAQRAASIPIAVRSQANRVVTFRQYERDDLGALTSVLGRDTANALPSLPPYVCFDWQDGKTDQYSVEADARRFLPLPKGGVDERMSRRQPDVKIGSEEKDDATHSDVRRDGGGDSDGGHGDR